MFGQKNWLIIYVTPLSLQLLGEGDSAPQTLALPSTIVGHLELLNKDALYTLITDWTKQKTYANTEITWLLSKDLCFTLPLGPLEPDKVDSEILQFLESVPFEHVLSHTYTTPEGRQVFATNQELIMALVQGFALHGYTTQSVLPASLIPLDTLSLETAKQAVKRAGELEHESLLAISASKETPNNPPNSSPSTNSHSNQPKSSLPLLLSVFGVLVAILGIVLYLNQ